MTELLILAATNQPLSDEMLSNAMLNVCINTNLVCDESCPVFLLNKLSCPKKTEYGELRGCDCYLDGKKMLEFVRENVGEVAEVPTVKPKKKKVVVPVEHIERFARFKVAVAAELAKVGVEKESRFFAMRNPLTPSQFVKIVEDYGINDFPHRRKELMSVVVEFQNSTKTYTSASQTIRKWLNIRLNVESFEDLPKAVQFGAGPKVVVPNKPITVPSFLDEIKNKSHE